MTEEMRNMIRDFQDNEAQSNGLDFSPSDLCDMFDELGGEASVSDCRAWLYDQYGIGDEE